jgi:hypothetical protein
MPPALQVDSLEHFAAQPKAGLDGLPVSGFRCLMTMDYSWQRLSLIYFISGKRARTLGQTAEIGGRARLKSKKSGLAELQDILSRNNLLLRRHAPAMLSN